MHLAIKLIVVSGLILLASACASQNEKRDCPDKAAAKSRVLQEDCDTDFKVSLKRFEKLSFEELKRVAHEMKNDVNRDRHSMAVVKWVESLDRAKFAKWKSEALNIIPVMSQVWNDFIQMNWQEARLGELFGGERRRCVGTVHHCFEMSKNAPRTAKDDSSVTGSKLYDGILRDFERSGLDLKKEKSCKDPYFISAKYKKRKMLYFYCHRTPNVTLLSIVEENEDGELIRRN